MEYEIFMELVEWLEPGSAEERIPQSPLMHWKEHRRSVSMSFKTAVGCGVLFLFGKGTLKEKAALLNVSRSSFERAAQLVIKELVLRGHEVITIPSMSKQVFLKCRRTGKPFPGALFAIDGTLCKLAVKGRRNDFYCRKGYACLNVQVMCDWNMNLVHVDPNYSGRTQDNDMYMSSPLRRAVDSAQCPLRPGGFIVGDEGYSNSGHIMRPYDERQADTSRKFFNIFFKSARLIIENAIGAWKHKCPLLDIGMHKMDPEDLAEVIYASAVLYQYCKYKHEEFFPPQNAEYADRLLPIPEEFLNKETPALRDLLRDYFVEQYPYSFDAFTLMNAVQRQNPLCVCFNNQNELNSLVTLQHRNNHHRRYCPPDYLRLDVFRLDDPHLAGQRSLHYALHPHFLESLLSSSVNTTNKYLPQYEVSVS